MKVEVVDNRPDRLRALVTAVVEAGLEVVAARTSLEKFQPGRSNALVAGLHMLRDPAFKDAITSLAGETPVLLLDLGSAPIAAKRDTDGVALSPRERQVLRQIANGRTHGQIARSLGISPHTVDTYVKRLKSKLDVGNKAELTRVALLGRY